VHPSVKDTPEAKAALKRAESATPAGLRPGSPASPMTSSKRSSSAVPRRRPRTRAREAVDRAKRMPATDGAGDPEPKLSKAELIAAVEAKTGKKPHPSTSEKKLRELLAG
jgi:hypothetical protein